MQKKKAKKCSIKPFWKGIKKEKAKMYKEEKSKEEIRKIGYSSSKQT